MGSKKIGSKKIKEKHDRKKSKRDLFDTTLSNADVKAVVATTK